MKALELKRWREQFSCTQEELAQTLGVYQETIARWETGKRKIPPYLHLALEALGKRSRKGGAAGR